MLSRHCRLLVHTSALEKHCIEHLCIFLLFFFVIKNVFKIFFQEYLEFRKERAKMLISRRNQLLLEFSFWNEPLPRPGPNIYEMRTYYLKVCTFITLIKIAWRTCFWISLHGFYNPDFKKVWTLCKTYKNSNHYKQTVFTESFPESM